ncbi:LOW QUALITY PROTEIN: nibrin [Culicoides brevitarsis]|uniref:LOW QUALITY PROTEIN: nibrin n=1 Tax=Culicoides brevitarsis TaxID=469753 RepID=UPI00307B9680
MWILRHLSSDLRFYLTPDKKTFSVGRSLTDFILESDQTISRRHASLIVKGNKLFILDEASKYKVFLNDGIESKIGIPQKKEVELKKGDRIRFGQYSNNFVVETIEMCTLTSTLTPPVKKELEDQLKLIGVKVTDSINDKFTHLTMQSIVITSKQLQALVVGVPLVTIEYWEEVSKAIKKHKPLPDVKKFLPKNGEPLLAQSHHLFHVNENRRKIFEGKVFYFFRASHAETYKMTIETAGGRALDLVNRANNVKKSQLIAENAVVIQYEASEQSQATQSIDSVANYVRSKKLRLIPEIEIQLAILHCSVEKYCNPRFKFSDMFAPLKMVKSDLWAKATEPQSTCDSVRSIRKLLPESLPAASLEDSVPPIPLKETNRNEKDDVPKSRGTRQSKRKLEAAEQNEPNKMQAVEKNDAPVGRRSTRRSSVKAKAVPEASVDYCPVEENAIVEEIVPESDPAAMESSLIKENEPVKEKSQLAPIFLGQKSSKSSPAKEKVVQPSHVAEEIIPESQPKAILSASNSQSFITSFMAATSSNEAAPAKSNSGSSTSENRRTRRRAAVEDDNDDILDPFACFDPAPKRQKTVSSPVAHVSRLESFRESPKAAQKSRGARNREDTDDLDSLFQLPARAALFKQPSKPAQPVILSQTATKEYERPQKTTTPNISIAANQTISSEGWLSASNIPHQPIKVEPDLDISEFEQKVANCFITEVKPMLLMSRLESSRDVTDHPQTTLNSTRGKNFKGFVKKRNYKPQTKIIGQKFEIIGLTQLKF